MLEFSCTYCGRRFRIAEESAGKKGTCPNCKRIVVIPESPTRLRTEDFAAGKPEPEVDNSKSPYDLTLLDLPERVARRQQPAGEKVPMEAYPEEYRDFMPGRIIREERPSGERKLPWIVDIFLYPMNKSGIIVLCIVAGIPFLLHFITKVLAAITLVFTPMFVFLVMFHVFRVLAALVLVPYACWYLCECIRDSALGAIRAVETAGSTPGLGELLSQIVRVIICTAISFAPSIVYLIVQEQLDAIFWVLYGCGVFLLPMALLAFVMFDSLSALNPLLVIGSVWSTFFQYVGLLIFLYAVSALVPLSIYFLRGYWVTLHLAEFLAFYLVMISAHLIGRFFWRYQEKLNWEV